MIGTLLGNHRVIAKIGEGGMGEVFRGRHETLGNSVAIKILLAELSRNADMVQRFFNEARAAAAIQNPGIVRIIDNGTSPDGRAYFVMELLEGISLSMRLQQGRLEYVEGCRIARQVATALGAVHAHKITHRDLKPDNLYLVADPEVPGGQRVKVLDFGIAKLAADLHATSQTRPDLVLGTPFYMSPEQCRGAGAVDTRSDIYSLGCILFEMVCGRRPFESELSGEILGQHQHIAPPAPRTFAPKLPGALDTLILQMLAKRPEDRPQTMAVVAKILEDLTPSLELAARKSSRRTLAASVPPLKRPAAPAAPSPVPAPLTPPASANAETAVVAISPSHDTVRVAPPPYAEPTQRPSSTTLTKSASTVTPGPPERTSRALYVLIIGGALAGAAIAAIVASTARDDDSAGAATATGEPDAPPAPPPDATVAVAVAAAPEPAPPPPPVAPADPAPDPAIELVDASLPAAAPPPRDVRAPKPDVPTLDAPGPAAKPVEPRPSKNPKRPRSEVALAAGSGSAAAALPPAPKPSCNRTSVAINEEVDRARELFAAGAYGSSLSIYDELLACRADQSILQKAFVVACNLKDVAKARSYWRSLSAGLRTAALGVCVRNGINEDELKGLAAPAAAAAPADP